VTEAAGPPPVIATPKVRTLAQERWSSLSAFVKTMSALKSVREKTHMRKVGCAVLGRVGCVVLGRVG